MSMIETCNHEPTIKAAVTAVTEVIAAAGGPGSTAEVALKTLAKIAKAPQYVTVRDCTLTMTSPPVTTDHAFAVKSKSPKRK